MTKDQYFQLLSDACDQDIMPSIGENKQCFYSKDGGKKCAIGLLIKNYDPSMEGKPVHQIIDRIVSPEGVSITDLALIQRNHDHFAAKGWDKRQFLQNVKAILYESRSVDPPF